MHIYIYSAYIYIYVVCVILHIYNIFVHIYIYIYTHLMQNRAQKPGCSDVTLPGDLVTIAKLDGTANDSPVDELDARLDL